jgi:preprotein translocase subunit SecG
MYTVLMVVQVLAAVSLIGLVLLQHGKGADAGAAFGSGASSTVFGSRGSANFLSRMTAWLATVFFAVSLALAYLVHGTSQEAASVVDKIQQGEPATVAGDDPAVVPEAQEPPATPQVPE